MDVDPSPGLHTITKPEFHPSTGLQICLLGGFRIVCGENVLTAGHIRLRKARHLFALLALAPAFRLHREHLMELLWPECTPQRGAHNLSQTLYALRSDLEALASSVRLGFDGECVALRADGGITTDVGVFEQLAHTALLESPPASREMAELLIEAILAYTGDLLPEDGPSDLFYRWRDQLRGLYLDLLLKLSDSYLDMAEYPLAIDSLRHAINIDPAAESIHVRLILAYALSGQRQSALRQYLVLEDVLRRELDVEPAPESQRLRRQIISGELFPPRLAPAAATNRGSLLVAPRANRSRLFIKVSESPLDEHTRGVIWVELVHLDTPPTIAKMIQK